MVDELQQIVGEGSDTPLAGIVRLLPIERLNAVLASPNKIRVLPGLRSGAEKALSVLNSLALARMSLGDGLEEVEDSVGGQLGQVRKQRKALEARLKLVPVTPSDFEGREQDATKRLGRKGDGYADDVAEDPVFTEHVPERLSLA